MCVMVVVPPFVTIGEHLTGLTILSPQSATCLSIYTLDPVKSHDIRGYCIMKLQ